MITSFGSTSDGLDFKTCYLLGVNVEISIVGEKGATIDMQMIINYP